MLVGPTCPFERGVFLLVFFFFPFGLFHRLSSKQRFCYTAAERSGEVDGLFRRLFHCYTAAEGSDEAEGLLHRLSPKQRSCYTAAEASGEADCLFHYLSPKQRSCYIVTERFGKVNAYLVLHTSQLPGV